MDDKLSYVSLERHVKYLQACGTYRLDGKSPKRVKILHTIYMRAVLAFFLIYTMQQVLKINQVRGDLDAVMGTLFLLLTYTDWTYKNSIYWKKSEEINELLDVMKGPLYNQGAPEHRSILMETVYKARLVFRIFNFMALMTCVLWIIHPTFLHLQGKYVDLPIWFPFDANKDPQYYFAIFYVWLQTSWLACSNTAMDVFITFTLEQCRTQVSILRLDLETLVEKSREEARDTSNAYDFIIEKRFNKMIMHHKEIVNMADKIQDIFGGAVFYQFLVSGWILCTSAYRIVNVNLPLVEIMSMLLYVACMLTEIFLYCYYGSQITYESEMLMVSAYGMDWLEMPLKLRRSLIIFMERIKRPIRPMAGIIIPLSNATFVSIVRSSYSFYALLKNSKH